MFCSSSSSSSTSSSSSSTTAATATATPPGLLMIATPPSNHRPPKAMLQQCSRYSTSSLLLSEYLASVLNIAETSICSSASIGHLASAASSSSTAAVPASHQQQQPSSIIDKTKLFVGNLPDSTHLDELVDLFGRFGPINHRLSVVKEGNYAFIHFYAESDALSAMRELNGVLLRNRYIRVEYSNSSGHIRKPPPVSSFLKQHQRMSF